MQIWKNLKYGFQEKQGRGGGVRQSGKFPDYSGFFLLKASLTSSLVKLRLPSENQLPGLPGSASKAVLPKGLPYGDKVCRQTILKWPFMKSLP